MKKDWSKLLYMFITTSLGLNYIHNHQIKNIIKNWHKLLYMFITTRLRYILLYMLITTRLRILMKKDWSKLLLIYVYNYQIKNIIKNDINYYMYS